ncbi:MAG: BlaI/MecI/CopY family transcriptional regulator [Clostridia bacterium]|nr:BlaI/MecI/CopY family transcriptional regulator [Clostridia bacterium]
MRKKIDFKKISDGELEVMQALWTIDGSATRKEIEDVLFKGHKMAMTTLLTFLSRLADKGFIKVEKIGNANVYSALVKRHDYLKNESNDFIKKTCGGSMSAFASALCDSGISKKDLLELKKYLEEIK